MKAHAFLVLLFVLITSAMGQEDETKCCCSTAEMRSCLSKVYETVDARLNEAYQQALTALARNYTAEDTKDLEEAQRLWASYRNAACKAEYGLYRGGSAAPQVQTLCMIRITRQRIGDLESAYLRLSR